MKNISSLFAKTIYLLTITILCWCLLANIAAIQPNQLPLLIVPLILMVSIIFIPKKYLLHLYSWITTHNKTTVFIGITLTLSSLLVRIFFATLDYHPTSDPATFLTMAEKLANGEGLYHLIYVGLFPYTLSYDLLLSFGLNIFQSAPLTIFSINLLFDLISACMIYFIAKKITNKRPISFLYAGLFLISPFCLFYATLSLPVAAVNTFILTTLFSVYLLIDSLKKDRPYKKIILYSTFMVLSLVALSYFRPISIIFIIALAIYLFITYLNDKSKNILVRSTTSLLIICTIYILGSFLYGIFVKNITGYTTKGGSGWSLFVGANIKSQGQWNNSDKQIQLTLSKTMQPSAIDKELKHLALKRISSQSIDKNATLLVHKSIILGGKQKDSFFNMKSYPIVKNNKALQATIVLIAFMSSLLLLFIPLFGLIGSRKEQRPQFLLYIALVFTGLFISSLLVEVNPRYFAPFIPLLIVICIFSIHNKYKVT